MDQTKKAELPIDASAHLFDVYSTLLLKTERAFRFVVKALRS
jgi:hypothetical protein